MYIDIPPFHDFSTLYLLVSHTARLSPSKTFTPTTVKHYRKLTIIFFLRLSIKTNPHSLQKSTSLNNSGVSVLAEVSHDEAKMSVVMA